MPVRVLLATLVSLAVGSLVLAQEKAGDSGEAKGPETITVKSGRFEITVDVKGTLGPDRVKTIAVEPEEWASLKVVDLAPQGRAVKKGDVILQLDTDGIDKAIRALEFSVKLAELSLEQTEREMAILERTTPLDLEIAERSFAQAKDDFNYFIEVEKELAKESTRRSVESAEFQLEYATEELVQLKKMYEQDDLTEETEEMILKRTERSVENAQYYLERARIRAKRELETLQPRQEQSARDALVQAELGFRRTRETTPLAMDKKKIEFTKQRYDLEQSLAKLKAMRDDRELLTVRSPVNGIVYHGVWKDGTWTLAANVKAALKEGGTLPAKTPVMAIVAPTPLSVRTTLEEKHVAVVREGATGTATPTAFPDTKLPCKVTGVSTFPVEPGKFGLAVAVDTGEANGLVPGMTVAIKLTAYENDDAITLPKKAVHEQDGEKVVYVVEKKGNVKRVVSRKVETGRSKGDVVEITDGLAKGDVVRTNKP